MKINVLTDNYAGGKYLAEHGLSLLIENEEEKLLFDTGHSDVFIMNARRMNIDIQKEIETIVLSHGHWDHGNGIQFLNDKTIITHPSSFIERYRMEDGSSIGLEQSRLEIEDRHNLICTEKSYKISENIIFLGEIPRLNSFESQTTNFIDSQKNADFVPDDSALAIIEDEELIVISGCSHSGICNIIEYAKSITGIDRVKAVIGGFHLKTANKQTHQTIAYLIENKIENLYPGHCTGFEALNAFASAKCFNINILKTGMQIDI